MGSYDTDVCSLQSAPAMLRSSIFFDCVRGALEQPLGGVDRGLGNGIVNIQRWIPVRTRNGHADNARRRQGVESSVNRAVAPAVHLDSSFSRRGVRPELEIVERRNNFHAVVRKPS
jgi:hypothetical protein